MTDVPYLMGSRRAVRIMSAEAYGTIPRTRVRASHRQDGRRGASGALRAQWWTYARPLRRGAPHASANRPEARSVALFARGNYSYKGLQSIFGSNDVDVRTVR